MSDLNSPTDKTEGSYISRRRHERVPTRGKVQACIKQPVDSEHPNREYQMEILEISPAGLRVRSTEPMYAEAIDLVATIDGYATEIFLSTYVRWQEEDDQGYTLFGVEIEDNDASDLDTWCDFQREEWFREKSKTLS